MNLHIKQSGAALFVALILLSILMILGVTAVKNSTLQERMAANTHQANWIFSAADSGLGAFNQMANIGDDVGDPNHILFRARTNGNVSFCVDENGNEALCGATFIDGNMAQVQVDVEPRGCVQQLCFGYSLGAGDTGNVQCLVYEVNSNGSGNGFQEQVEWWAYQLTAACPN
ncbi:MAG: pilus assembly PilX N-terminal domain-containing protein [Kangiellaceae bacterium]|jgi:type IV pilus assembly protein PilX|nr:pilus assembly PilX N-terminal domain-containing protein [Kangiellaceae bacterium]